MTLLYEFRPAGPTPRLRPLRYQNTANQATGQPATQRDNTNDRASEFAYLSIRYKLPGEKTAKEISQPVDFAKVHESLDATPREARFATAVAAFGLTLRNTSDLGEFGLAEVAQLADGARGPDPRGERAEFLRLVRDAESLLRTAGN